ncbi:DUF1573 domain-containing protein [Flavobacterium salilacus subsp. salilacus]|uniref:DUF1573 domain-containing protein n=1 Tax=Flavobacterium TaxID=237 RepID=UPI0013C3418D|nr:MULTISPECIES: DUF1573 domain-containing protein [Flavobacterium]KAF2519002.1 DUF1573 domain-containing protein [Flavobacterium salilacus subsp. salilacus]MBE1614835.1 DUF1573 domain-containing protein [Flavobacterium sp. SaA2.13]
MRNNILLFVITIMFLSCDKKTEFATIEFEKEIDFGTISSKDTVIKIFKIYNTSEIPLKISEIGTSCGCTGAILSDSIVKKGNYAEIEVSYHPKKEETGSVSNSIVIEANTNPPYTALYLKGNVIE